MAERARYWYNSRVEDVAMSLLEPAQLTAAEVDATADVLVRAFAADPGVLFVLPDIAARERHGSSLSRAMVRLVMRCGAPLVVSRPVRGFALWFPPDAAAPTDRDIEESGLAGVPGEIGEEAWARLKALMDLLDVCHPCYAPDPHWYLAMLGVDPDWQRQGIGEALMRPVFDRAERDGLPCYLEAPTSENVRYYLRRGFAVVGEADVPGSDVHLWFMRREAGSQRG